MEVAMATQQKLKPRLFSLTPRAMTIEAVDGEETFIRSGLFSYIKPSFVNSYRGGAKEATSKTRVLGVELLAPANFREIFEPLGGKIEELVLTENQIVNLLRRERKWMMRGGTTYFLFKYGENICVAAIFPTSSKGFYGVDVYLLDNLTVWPNQQFKNCAVVPRRR